MYGESYPQGQELHHGIIDLQSWKKKAFYTIKSASAEELNKQWDELTERLTPLNGVLYIANGGAYLLLEVELRALIKIDPKRKRS